MYHTAALNYCTLYPLSWAGGNYTMLASYTPIPGLNSIASYAKEYRIVTAGLIIRNVSPALSASGYIIINRLPTMPAVSSVNAQGNVYGVQSSTFPITAGMEIPVVFRPQGMEARSFDPLQTTNTAFPNEGWDTISIEMVGGPTSGAVLDIEFIYNVEFNLTVANQGLQQFLPTTAPSSPAMQQISNVVSTSFADTIYNGVKKFSDGVVKAVTAKLKTSPDPKMQLIGLGVDYIREVD